MTPDKILALVVLIALLGVCGWTLYKIITLKED